jgi:pimeloyl-ACP methyl ester carboxylesterase
VSYTPLLLEVFMKWITVLALLVVVACGGTQAPPAPAADAPTAAVAGPGSVAAPDGVAIAYTVAGAGSPALVFIHGWMCDQSYWSEQLQPFGAAHTVVTIDLPGHGQSGMERAGWSLAAFGADVRAVAQHLGLEEIILVGHSMGGPVALEAARLMPDRVIGVIGVDTLHNVHDRYDPEQMAAIVAAFEADFESTCGEFVEGMFPDGADPELIDSISADMAEGPPQIGTALMAQFEHYDAAAALAAVAVPVRSINSDLWPTDVEANRSVNDDYDAVIVDGVGHFLMMEAPDVFNQHLREVLTEISGAE